MFTLATPLSQIEVDIANSSEHTRDIYQAMEVPEVWIYKQEKLTINVLQQNHYVNASTSTAFPSITVMQLNEWIQLRQQGTDLTVIKAIRNHCRTLQSS